MMKSLTDVIQSPRRTEIAPPPTALSPTLPLGLTEMAGSMTQQQLSAAMEHRQTPLTRDQARVLQQWLRAVMSYRTSLRGSLDTEYGQEHFQELVEIHGKDRVFRIDPQKTERRNFFQPVYVIPRDVSVDEVRNAIIEMIRPSSSQSIIRISQVMARKPLFNNDEISAKNAIADTHELLSQYSDFVYFLTCQDAMDSDEKYFPIPSLWRGWANENAEILMCLKNYFLIESENNLLDKQAEHGTVESLPTTNKGV